MYLSRLRLNRNRVTLLWVANPYHVHQRLSMGCEHDPRLLFRIEDVDARSQIIVQSHSKPDWDAAFAGLPVLSGLPECKSFELNLVAGARYAFRLLANPTLKRGGKRLGLLREVDQRTWLERKMEASGSGILTCSVIPRGMMHSRKEAASGAAAQTHLAVQFDGVLQVADPTALSAAVGAGIGAAKGFGFGLLSLAAPGGS
jgi:CRISPR system Cascade subunit CasE